MCRARRRSLCLIEFIHLPKLPCAPAAAATRCHSTNPGGFYERSSRVSCRVSRYFGHLVGLTSALDYSLIRSLCIYLSIHKRTRCQKDMNYGLLKAVLFEILLKEWLCNCNQMSNQYPNVGKSNQSGAPCATRS